ncbi:putative M18 family aminopeptidase 2 [Capsicum baccatum]|uniref:aspartyl aminopeptidase n=1 Tax=Capsicum baccatum TaxID=33114 RepID=A0A2G2W683_CAPBA|nr:putative M18 family aminopeptidase 2 [Capsicum baccatum]
MRSREKVNPMIINSDVHVLMYMMDADVDGLRPILRINIVEMSFEGPDFGLRNDMGYGSTIGPILASRVGIRTVDCGIAQLSIHSVREICGYCIQALQDILPVILKHRQEVECGLITGEVKTLAF